MMEVGAPSCGCTSKVVSASAVLTASKAAAAFSFQTSVVVVEGDRRLSGCVSAAPLGMKRR